MTGSPKNQEQLRGLRVLLVEDLDLVAMQIEEMLRVAGCNVVAVAGSLADASNAARTLELDLAVLDIHIEGGNVFEVADVLRSKGVAIVFSTGDSDRSLPSRFVTASHVKKPFAAEALWSALEQALS